MSTYANNTYTYWYESDNPYNNLRSVVRLLTNNTDSLTIIKETEAKTENNKELPLTTYEATVSYSGFSQMRLEFKVVTVSDLEAYGTIYLPQIRITQLAPGTTETYSYYYDLSVTKWSDTSTEMTYKDYLSDLTTTHGCRGMKLDIMTIDNVPIVNISSVNSSGSIRNVVGRFMMAPMIDYFTSGKIAGIFYAYNSYEGNSNTGYYTDTSRPFDTMILNSGSGYVHHSLGSTSDYPVYCYPVSGEIYESGLNGIAVPLLVASKDMTTVNFYGFAVSQNFLVGIWSGTQHIVPSFGQKATVGEHTFVGVDSRMFAMIS